MREDATERPEEAVASAPRMEVTLPRRLLTSPRRASTGRAVETAVVVTTAVTSPRTLVTSATTEVGTLVLTLVLTPARTLETSSATDAVGMALAPSMMLEISATSEDGDKWPRMLVTSAMAADTAVSDSMAATTLETSARTEVGTAVLSAPRTLVTSAAREVGTLMLKAESSLSNAAMALLAGRAETEMVGRATEVVEVLDEVTVDVLTAGEVALAEEVVLMSPRRLLKSARS